MERVIAGGIGAAGLHGYSPPDAQRVSVAIVREKPKRGLLKSCVIAGCDERAADAIDDRALEIRGTVRNGWHTAQGGFYGRLHCGTGVGCRRINIGSGEPVSPFRLRVDGPGGDNVAHATPPALRAADEQDRDVALSE